MNDLPDEDLQLVLAQTRGLWEELAGAIIFITGGTGFFGCWLVRSLLKANARFAIGARVTILTRDVDAFRRKAPAIAGNPAVKLMAGDARGLQPSGERYSHVIHAASGTTLGPQAETESELRDTIVEGTRRVLDFAVRSGAKKFLLTSSGAVYGRQPPGIEHIAEDFAQAPDSLTVYGRAKREVEQLCIDCAAKHGLEAKIARCFAFVGPYLPFDTNYAVGNFLRDALAGGPICVNGDGTLMRSYLHAADLAAWLWTILLRGKSTRPYNVGSELAVSIRELAENVAAVVAPGAEVLIAKSRLSNEPAERYIPSTQRAQAELGLRQTISLTDAIARTAAWARRTE